MGRPSMRSVSSHWPARKDSVDDGLTSLPIDSTSGGCGPCFGRTWPGIKVSGVQRFGMTNMLAPQDVQREFAMHTAAERFLLPELLWPDAEQIATLVARRIGRTVGDLSAVAAPLTGDRAVDPRGVRMMHS